LAELVWTCRLFKTAHKVAVGANVQIDARPST
jgi:hypothetical protein